MGFDRDRLADALHADDSTDLPILKDSLRVDPSAPKILAKLARDRMSAVRFWAAAISSEVAGREALPWLLEMAKGDQDYDNRAVALKEIVAIDVDALAPLISDLRRQLGHMERQRALTAAKALTFAHDRDSLPAMRALAESWEPNIYYRKVLETYILALDGREDVLFERIRAHDHICMGWLAYACEAFVRTLEARGVLEWGAENLPDDKCRDDCVKSLQAGNWQNPRTLEG